MDARQYDKPLELIRRYKNERLPNFAVTVDLLTTGIDVPAICNLVFLRRVGSRILFDQMLGCATCLCDGQAALGKGLVPWVERIAAQTRANLLMDREALDAPSLLFKCEGGGFQRLDRIFEGHLRDVLETFNESLWQQDDRPAA